MKKTLFLMILLYSFLFVFSIFAVNAYNYYTQVYPQNYDFMSSGVDYANHTIGAYNYNYYGMSPKNLSQSTYYIKRFNVSTVLGTSTMIERDSVTISHNTGGGVADTFGNCPGHLPCGIMDMTVDPHTGYIYYIVRPTVGNFAATLVAMNPDFTGSQVVDLYRSQNSTVHMTLGGSGSFTSEDILISVDTSQSPGMVLTLNGVVYFLEVNQTPSGKIASAYNASIPLSLSDFYTYVTGIKIGFYPQSYIGTTDMNSAYYLINEYVPDRDANPHDLYLLSKSDLTVSGLRTVTFDSLAYSTPYSELVSDSQNDDSFVTTRHINKTYYLTQISSSNFTPVTNGSATCFTGYGCYNTSSYCLTGTSQGYYCNNTVFTQVSNYVVDQCDAIHVQYCSQSCTNTLVNGVYTGACTQTNNCTNTCNILGAVQCTNTNTYATCGNYNGESCLSLGAFTQCPQGSGCVSGVCLAYLTNVSTTTKPLFYVSPKPYNTNITNAGTSNFYVINYVDNTKNTINYYTSLTSTLQEYKISTSEVATYTARNCNYAETSLYNNVSAFTSNSTNIYLFNGFTSGKINTSFVPQADGVSLNTSAVLITGQDATNKYVYRFYFVRDYNTNLCLYQANSTSNVSASYWCDSNIVGDIANINFDVLQITQSGGDVRYQSETVVTMSNGAVYTHDTAPLSREDSSASTTYKVTMQGYDGTNPATVEYKGLQVLSGQGYTLTWDSTLPEQYQQPCQYTTSPTCYKVRTYLSDNKISLFNFVDWNFCTQTTKSSINTASNEQNLIEQMTPLTKILVALGVSLGVFLLIFIIGFIASTSSDSPGTLKFFGYVGVFFSVGFLIYFIIKGFLPAWLVIVMIGVTVFVIVMLIRGLFGGRQEM